MPPLVTSAPTREAQLLESREVPDVFLAFIREKRPLLQAFLRSREVDPDDIDDIIQDCMERLIRYYGCNKMELHLLLHRIARNRLADLRRSEAAQINASKMQMDQRLEDTTPASDPLQQAIGSQTFGALLKALSTLPTCTRETYLLNRFNGMSYSQIARHRGVTLKTVEKQISRALQDLRRILDPEIHGSDDSSK